jgi:hypothetical protein
MKLLCLLLLSSGCFFNGGTTNMPSGLVDGNTLCPPAAEGCPACSSPDGAMCRDQWYSTALRCASDAQCNASGACQHGYCVKTDADGDGIDDDFEREVAQLNMPVLYMAAGEPCGGPHGIIYHVRRHPLDASKLAITYVVLYTADCGVGTGHVGDAESFAITVDLDAEPGAPGTVGVAAWAHGGTSCGSTSSCDAAPGTSACSVAGGHASSDIVLYASYRKHATYLSAQTCSDNCFDSCSIGERITGPLLNVGEPDHPLVTDLTDQGFVRAADGWNSQLLHINPWGSVEFGGGGRLDQPLTNYVAPPGRAQLSQ